MDKVETSSRFIKTQQHKLDSKRHSGYQITVTLSPQAPVGTLSGVLTLHTNLKKYGPIDVPILAEIQGSIQVHPEMLSLGSVTKGEVAARRVSLVSNADFSFHIKETKTNLPFIQAKIQKTASQNSYKVGLQIKNNAPSGKVKGQLTVLTDSPEQERIKVPFVGLIHD